MVFHGFKDSLQKYRVIAGILDKKPNAGPYSVHLDLTNHCNNDCISCWSFSPLVGFKTMDEETRKKQLPYKLVKRLLDDLSEMKTREVYFTGGGEPFMHPDAVRIMEYVKKKGMRCDMSTNFTLINEAIAERFVKAGIDHLHCSIWAGSIEAYERTHPNKTGDTFKRLADMLLYLHRVKKKNNSKKPELTLYNVISTKNNDDFYNMVEFAFKVKADAIEFTPTDIVPGLTDELMLTKEMREQLAFEVSNVWPRIHELEEKYGHKVAFKGYDLFLTRLKSDEAQKGIYDKSMIGKMPCYAGFSFLRILATGEVNSCLKSGRIPIGNIYENLELLK